MPDPTCTERGHSLCPHWNSQITHAPLRSRVGAVGIGNEGEVRRRGPTSRELGGLFKEIKPTLYLVGSH